MPFETSRRSFLGSLAAAGAAAPLLGALPATPNPAPQKILVLGGTGFLGPHFVRLARANGHTITLFNRGKSNPGLFADIEQLRGDREKGDLESLQGREFDVVVDTSGYVPAHVEATAKLFAAKAKHYQFISTVSVYPGFGSNTETITEATPVGTVGDEDVAKVSTIRQSMPFYGPLKARCEAAAEVAMPGRTCVIRPGLIVGPGDPTDRFTWWPARIDQGGEVLAPGDPDGQVQFVDARDLAAWMLHCVEQSVVGVHNATGPAGSLSMHELLAACKCATTNPVTLVWASEEFLAANEVQPWMQMPLWIPREGRAMVDCSRAIAAGLRFRPVADTVRDTLAWVKAERAGKPFTTTGLPAERERGLITKLRAPAGK
jgi:2'-hydroxyisoflavone reductase